MDLGIAGRTAIVCASSRGLGRACALALAQAGCDVVINGRDGRTLDATAAELRQAIGAKVTAVQCDVASPEGQAALLGACPEPDILVKGADYQRAHIVGADFVEARGGRVVTVPLIPEQSTTSILERLRGPS